MFVLFLLGGLAFLVAGGELLVRGASSIAGRLGLSPMIIGITLVGFGTSTPELVTSLQAAFAGAPGMALGNVVGSNTANILLILGVTALIAPIAIEKASFGRDGTMMVLAALICLVAVQLPIIGPVAGLAMLTTLAAYLIYAVRKETRRPIPVDSSVPVSLTSRPKASLPLNLGLAIAGIALTILGARLFVSGAIDAARLFGVSETLIGLTLVAVGTSLPELATSVIAALKKQGAMAFGNVIGSNIFNVLCILGITAIIHPLPVDAQIAGLDIWVMLAATLLLVGMALSRWRISKNEGRVLLGLYLSYTVALFIFS